MHILARARGLLGTAHIVTALGLLVTGLALVTGATSASAAPAATTQPATTVAATHTIATAGTLAPPEAGSGGGGPIDFWKVNLAGGDDVQFNLTYNGSDYEYALYPPGTTDANFGNATPVDSVNTQYYGITEYQVSLQAPYNGTFVVAVCENVADGNCANVAAGSGTNPMDAYSFAATWLNHVTPTQQANETMTSTTIAGARNMPLGNYESGGGGPIDFWKVTLNRGDTVTVQPQLRRERL